MSWLQSGPPVAYFFHRVEIPLSVKQLTGYDSEYYLQPLRKNWSLWLFLMTKLILFSCVFLCFFIFLTSLIKVILWLKLFHRQKVEGKGNRVLFHFSCSFGEFVGGCELKFLFFHYIDPASFLPFFFFLMVWMGSSPWISRTLGNRQSEPCA